VDEACAVGAVKRQTSKRKRAESTFAER